MTATTGRQRNLSVRQRLTLLGATALLGFGSMLATGFYQNIQVEAALDLADSAQANVRIIDKMRLANAEVVLAAMDTIIDREEKVVQPERLKIIENDFKILSDVTALRAVAVETGQGDTLNRFEADVAEMKSAIAVDLKAMVENGAPGEAYDAIDDTIDGAGERVKQSLEAISNAGAAFAAERVAEAGERSHNTLVLQIVIGLVAMITMLVMLVINGNILRRGIETVLDGMQRVLSGDLDSRVPQLERSDEIGTMARALEQFRQAAVEKRSLEVSAAKRQSETDDERASRDAQRAQEVAQVQFAVEALGRGLNRLAEGNLTETISQTFHDDLESVRRDYNQTVTRLQRVLSDVSANASSIHANSRQMRSAADDLSRRTEQQAASLEETSAALSQITSTVKSSTDKAEEATRMVDATRINAEESGRIVGEAISAMARIETASNEIGKIINVIDEIAFQTNLLALNAGVEAARAGEAGKGFAVVAQEVRELAQRAAGAAKDIKSLVARSGEEVGTGVKLVQATGEALGRIGEDVVRINEHVRSIAQAARDQSIGLNEINTAIGQLDQMTQQNAAMVEETNAASHTLAQDADNLTQIIGQFRLDAQDRGRASVNQNWNGASHTPSSTTSSSVRTAAPVSPVRAVAPTIAAGPVAATRTSRAAPSPAKALLGRLSGAFDSNSNPPASKPSTSGENWEEF
ncbi:methyl-accepting chemotaxis protein [Rhizobium sp. RU20A]|uniref:methyl-accepting chemotaxis protein n=1 Tax=Rhizobium sp. RU20A TaxID=1907412 RepID=UPI000953E282|nr:methyl-accepting chemotaxis protein [Rhizobium sp. RU20A]SIQ20263.1 methyl-accepting chemotaxis protein [Rhizobium sp. RU20A]